MNRHGPIEGFPKDVLDGKNRERALLFKDLATLRTDADLFDDVEELRWDGPTEGFAGLANRMDAAWLVDRCRKAQSGQGS